MTTKQLSIVVKALDQFTAPMGQMQRSGVTALGSIGRAGEAAAGGLTRVVGGVTRLASVIAPLTAVLGGGALAYGVVSSLRQTVDELDNLGETARKLDLPVKDLAELRYAAQVAGVDVGRLGSALDALRKNVGEFARLGTGRAADELANLARSFAERTGQPGGRLFEDADGRLRSIADLLPDLIDEIGRFEAGDQAVLAQKIFGDQDLVLLFQQSRRGLADLRAEARALGAALDSVDTDAAERLDDALRRVRVSLSGLRAQLLVELEPLIAGGANTLAETLAGGRPLIRGGAQLVRDLLGDDAQLRAEAGAGLQRIISELGTFAAKGGVALGRTVGEGVVDGLGLALVSLGPTLVDALGDAINDVRAQLQSNAGLRAAFSIIAGPSNAANAFLAQPVRYSPRRLAQEAARSLADARAALAAEEGRQAPRQRALDAGNVLFGDRPETVLAPLRERVRLAENAAIDARNKAAAVDAGRGALTGEFLRQSVERAQANLRPFIEAAQDGAAGIGGVLRDSANGRGAFRAQVERYGALFAEIENGLGKGDAGGGPAKRLEAVGKAAESLVGPPVEAVEQFAAKVRDLVASLDLEARELDALGRAREADRVRLVRRFDAEIAKFAEYGSATDDVRARVTALRDAQLAQFDFETDAARVSKELARSLGEYREGLKARADLVEAGTIREAQATRQNLASADALRISAAASLAQLDAIIARAPALSEALASAREQAQEALRVAGIARPGGRRSLGGDGLFGDGFGVGGSRALDELIAKANDFEAQGYQAFSAVGDVLQSGIVDGTLEAIENFDNLGEVGRNVAAGLFREFGRVALQLVALRVIGGIAGAFAGPSTADVGARLQNVPLNVGGFALGGLIGGGARLRGYPMGGLIAPPPGDNTIIGARVGEYVLRESAVKSIGLDRLNAMNARGAGGMGGGSRGGGGGGGDAVVNVSLSVTINGGGGGGAETQRVLSEVRALPEMIVERLRRDPSYRSRFGAAAGGRT